MNKQNKAEIDKENKPIVAGGEVGRGGPKIEGGEGAQSFSYENKDVKCSIRSSINGIVLTAPWQMGGGPLVKDG